MPRKKNDAFWSSGAYLQGYGYRGKASNTDAQPHIRLHTYSFSILHQAGELTKCVDRMKVLTNGSLNICEAVQGS
jgi:hypothetical protein